MVQISNPLAKIAVNKSLLKEYSNSEYLRVVYMKNNSEFQIQIFNPYDYTIGADISINGKQMSNRIIIKPGQRIWLERYLDEARKFLFSTYEVENSHEAKQAIRNNGLVSISFYKEKIYEPIHIYTNQYNPFDYKLYNCDVNINAATVDNNYSLSSSATSAASYTSTSYTAQTLGLDNAYANKSVTRGLNKSARNATIETGRIEKGSHSNQEFENVFIDFEYCSFAHETIQILPESQKPYTDKDLKKVYCVNCGRKLNTKYKFCPYCGQEIVY
jgi:hypothetical protein